MKKLMILAAAVVASVAANAAAVSWDSGVISLPDGSKAGKGDVTAYLFNVTKAVYDTYAAYTDATALSDALYTAYSGSFASADGTKTSPKAGTANLTDGKDDYGVGTYYAVVLYTTTQDAKDYWMGNYASATIDAAQDVAVSDLALKLGGTSTTATAWSTAAVPEPTSGLLMLLGMAGLALRRRRA